MNIKIIPLMILTLSSSFAQQLLTLDEAIKTALNNNFSINIASSRQEIAENNLSLGNAGFLPNLDASGTYTESTNNARLQFFSGDIIDRTNAESNNLNANLTLDWTLFDGLSMFATYDVLKKLRDIGEINYRVAVENNITDVISTYYNLVRQGVVLEVNTRNISISEERVKLATAKRDVGSASKFELLQAQVDLNEDRSFLMTAELAFEQSKTFLNQLMGRNPAENFLVSDTIIIKEGILFEDIQLSARNKNSEIQRAVQDKELSEAELSISRSDIFPEIGIFGSYNFLRSETEAGQVRSNKNRGYTYGLRATISLFNGLNTRRQIENAQIETEISELEYKETVNRVESSLQNVYKAYQNSLRLVELETENLQVTEENVAIALERLRLGNITPVEFREAQISLIDAQSRLVNAQYEAKNAETELLRISGQIINVNN